MYIYILKLYRVAGTTRSIKQGLIYNIARHYTSMCVSGCTCKRRVKKETEPTEEKITEKMYTDSTASYIFFFLVYSLYYIPYILIIQQASSFFTQWYRSIMQGSTICIYVDDSNNIQWHIIDLYCRHWKVALCKKKKEEIKIGLKVIGLLYWKISRALFFFFLFFLLSPLAMEYGFTWYITCQKVYKTIIILVATQYTPVYI